METIKPQQLKQIKHPGEWGLKEMEEDLLSSGAIEITPKEMKDERFQKNMKNVKRNDKFICD